jgi:hypothetical protein
MVCDQLGKGVAQRIGEVCFDDESANSSKIKLTGILTVFIATVHTNLNATTGDTHA